MKLGHSTHVVFLGSVFVLFFRPLFFTCVLLLYWFQFGLRFCRMIKEVNESLGGGAGDGRGRRVLDFFINILIVLIATRLILH